jgi:hypothetical protein
MINDLVLGYVGKRNHEIVSALISSIWSGTAFFSGQMFKYLRAAELAYWEIFLLTAGIYAIGVYFYLLLIRKQRGLVEEN